MARILVGACLAGTLCGMVPALAQPAPPPAEKACLRPGEIYDYQPVPDNRAIVITDLAHRHYRLTFMGICRNLEYHIALKFKTFGVGGLSCVSRGDQIQMRDPVTTTPCIVKSIDYQTPALDQADAAAAAAAKR